MGAGKGASQGTAMINEEKMTILQNLWSELWEKEENRKTAAYHAEVERVKLEATVKRMKPTELQELALDQGASRRTIGEGLRDQQMVAHLQHLKLQAQTQAQVKAQAQILQHAMLVKYNQANAQAGLQTAGIGIYANPTIGKNLPIGTSPITVSPVRSLGSNARDILYLTLKGIEENGINKEGAHRYDDLAMSIIDMRRFSPEEVDLLGLCSFCVANMYPVQPILTLLQSYGVKVVMPSSKEETA